MEKSVDEPADRPGRGSDKFPLRFPDGLRDRIKEAAASNNRTMNAEIVSRLERYPSLGGEVDAMWEVARALASEIDIASGAVFASSPLTDRLNDAFTEVDEAGNLDRVKIARDFGSEANRRLSAATASGEPHLPEGLSKRLQRSAEGNGRTFDEELVYRVETSFHMETHENDVRRILTELIQRTNLMQEIAERYGRWRASTFQLILTLADLADDRMTPELRQQISEWRKFDMAREQISNAAEDSLAALKAVNADEGK